MVSVPLVELAEREFPCLMRHATNREDALQVLSIVQWQAEGRDVHREARVELSKLARGLGFRRFGHQWLKAA